MSKVKFELDKKALKKAIDDIVANTEYDVECPNCNAEIKVRIGENVCPHCSQLINLDYQEQ